MSGPTAGPVPGVEARRVALGVLARVEDDGAYANLALGPALEGAGFDKADRALVTDLVYGTLRQRRLLDHRVDVHLSSPPPPAARRALRLGAYQVDHRPDIPAYAAVSATVGAAPKRFRGLVNAVLRKVAAEPAPPADEATALSVPDWVLRRLSDDLGHDRAVGALAAMNEPARVHVRPDGYVQDPASQLVTDAVVDALSTAGHDPSTALVADLCSAPGGKATGLAGRVAAVVAADVTPGRAGLVADNARRLGLSDVLALVADATAPALRPGSVPAVLLDAPCSGLGVLRRRPDARWRVDEAAPQRLAALQRRMVDAAAALVAEGGVLVYSVCTLTAVESLGIDDHVAAHHPHLEPLGVPDGPWEPWGRGALLLPTPGGPDGMALLRWVSRGSGT